MSSNTIFGKILRGEIPAEVVLEDDEFLCIKDIQPLARVHILVIPKVYVRDISTATNEHQALLGRMMLVGAEVARQTGIEEGGYRLVFNCGADGGLEVPHLHLHVIGGERLGAPA